MADPHETDRALDDVRLKHTSGSVVYGMQLAVFERLSQDTFVTANALPAWFLRLTPAGADIDRALSLTHVFPALEGFLPVAEGFWADVSTGPLQSDFWTETDAQGIEYHLLAFAAKADARNFLVLERAEARFIERQQLQLYAHQMATQYDAIARQKKGDGANDAGED